MGIYKRGEVFWARWDEDGKQHRKSLGTKRRSTAEQLFKDLTGKVPAPPKPAALTVREILDLWVKHQTPRCKPHSIRLYKVVRKRFSLVWGDLPPEEISTLLVEQFQEKSLTVGLGPRTINHNLGIVISALQWAHDRELIDAAPPKWKPLKIRDKHSRKYLTASELKKLLTTVRNPRWKRLEPVIMLALFAGLRHQECMWLSWDSVDLVEGWLNVRATKSWTPKSIASERSIPIAHELADYLTSAPRVCSRWVAPLHPRQKWKRQHLGAEARRLFKAAGVDDGGVHTLHRLRGTFATSVLRGGGDLESLREVLGHSVLSVTAGYLSSTSESKRRAVGGLSFGGG